MSRRSALLVAALMMLAACSDATTGAGTTVPAATAPSTTTTVGATTTTAVATTTSTIAPTTLPPSTVAATTLPSTTVAPTGADDFLGEETIGLSAQGRPITVSHRGTAGGTVILVVGVIHGNENAGLAILDDLRTMPLPQGVDLWLMPALNPDGLANNVRHNGNGVDLNRNFPHDWTQVAQPGDWEYSGTGPASEPETQAFIAFANRIKPHLTLWYHQDLHRVSPSNRKDGPLRQKYAELTGLEYVAVTGGTYTGVAATWVRTTVSESMSFIVELGPTLSAEEAAVHADAVLQIVVMAQSIP